MSENCHSKKETPKTGGCASDSKKVKTSCCEPTPPIQTSCCSSKPAMDETEQGSSCCPPKEKFDFILWGSVSFIVISLITFFLSFDKPHWLHTISHTSAEMLGAMWWGVLLAIFFVGLLGRVPRELVMAVLGKGGSKRGLLRATGAGLLLDLCSHGILMVGMKLYERGASIGQVMAFLIASPWNSFSLTLIMFGLIGFKLTLTFIIASAIIALISGYIFDMLVANKTLPQNPNWSAEQTNGSIKQEFSQWWQSTTWSANDWKLLLVDGLKSSRMVLRWLLFGIVLVSIVRVLMNPDNFAQWFGASMSGLILTLIATTIIEVCSEGSTPIAADLVNRAHAPGNAFTFLMAGVATDYTEIMSIKDTMSSWKIALFLPLITVPQVVLIGWLLNQ